MDVIATAGHVDHGKSTLVRALTGMEPDRWEEERRRGLTIDLGFAWTTLPSGRTVAVDSEARVGGGGAPEHPLPSAAVSLPAQFAVPLRAGTPPVVGYVAGDRTLLDVRSLPPADDETLAAAVLEVARRWT